MISDAKAFARKLVAKSNIAVLSTISDSEPIVATVFYVTRDCSRLYYKSRTESLHALALVKQPLAAVGIYDPSSTYDLKTGLQLKGPSSRVVERDEMQFVANLYGTQFGPSAAAKLDISELLSADSKSTMYFFDIKEFKLVSHELDLHMEQYEPFAA